MKRLAFAVVEWFEFRLGIKDQVTHSLMHPVPPKTGYWYVFGSAAMTLLMLQLVTGVLLVTVYVPSAEQAYESIQYLNYEQYLGWLLRAMHFWGSTLMVIMVTLHMMQVFIFGAFKYPRELTWVIGVFLFALTLGMGFTGQVLRWDQDAYWGVGVGASMAGRVPLIGPQVVQVLLGGPTIGGETLTRFYALHVFVLPGALLGLLAVHLHLVMRQGVSSMPAAGKTADPEVYDEQYKKDLAIGEPFWPDPILKDGIFSALTLLLVFTLSVTIGPFGPSGPPDPTVIDANPRPEWFIMPLFGLLSLCPPEMETFVMLVFPALVFAVLLVVPFVAGRGERSPTKRPIAIACVAVIFIFTMVLGRAGFNSSWSPVMTAWSGDPVPVHLIEGRSPVELMGAAVLQNKNCRNCHSLDEIGGHRGPDLTNVASRLTDQELVRQVIQGGGDMPAYGVQLSPAEVEALVAYLMTLRDADVPPARNPVPESEKPVVEEVPHEKPAATAAR